MRILAPAVRRDRRPRASGRAQRVLRDDRRRATARRSRVYRAANAAASPLRYEIDGAEQYRIQMEIDDADLDLGAIYHSHTRSDPYPSQTDINLAFYPEALYVIVGPRRRASPRSRRTRSATAGSPTRSSASWPMASSGERCAPAAASASSSARAAARASTRSERFCPDCALPLVQRRRRREAEVSERHRAGAQDQAAARRGRARPRRRRAQPGRGRVHPGAAARGGRPEPAAAQRRASTCPTSWPPARATCSCRLGRRDRARGPARRPS